MIMKKIKSIKKIRQSKDGQLYYVSREIVKFNQTNAGFVAIYQEELFDIVEDSENNKSIVIIETYEQVPSPFSFTQVASLFAMINEPILSTDNFVEKFDKLQIQAMLIDTINQTELGRYGTKEWEIYDETQLFTTT